jgi:hypothetical protein
MKRAVSSLAGWVIRATLGTGGRLRRSEAMMDDTWDDSGIVVVRSGEKREERRGP